jgi:hypothetical protein
VDEARRRIRKALDLFVDDAQSANLVDNRWKSVPLES